MAGGTRELAVTSDPLGGAAGWHEITVDPGLGGLSCVSRRFCVGIGGAGFVITSTSPLRLRSWRSFYVRTSVPINCGKYGPMDDCQAALTGISCPSVHLCVVVDSADGVLGDVITTTRPQVGAGAGVAAPVSLGFGGAGFEGVACASVRFCLAVDGLGEIWASRRPSDGGRSWRRIYTIRGAVFGESNWGLVRVRWALRGGDGGRGCELAHTLACLDLASHDN